MGMDMVEGNQKYALKTPPPTGCFAKEGGLSLYWVNQNSIPLICCFNFHFTESERFAS